MSRPPPAFAIARGISPFPCRFPSIVTGFLTPVTFGRFVEGTASDAQLVLEFRDLLGERHVEVLARIRVGIAQLVADPPHVPQLISGGQGFILGGGPRVLHRTQKHVFHDQAGLAELDVFFDQGEPFGRQVGDHARQAPQPVILLGVTPCQRLAHNQP